MRSSWSEPDTATIMKPDISLSKNNLDSQEDSKSHEAVDSDDKKYNALVVDSGAIIKHSGFTTLQNAATTYYTSQGVYDEIRDSQARKHLESLPFELKVREPSKEGMMKVLEFSRKTGDYASLSAVDLQILGLLYDLEKEGCESMSHIRTEPRHMLGLGKISSLHPEGSSTPSDVNDNTLENLQESVRAVDLEGKADKGGCKVETDPLDSNCPSRSNKFEEEKVDENRRNAMPKTWAALVNPNLASTIAPDIAVAPIETPTTLGAKDTNLSSKPGIKKTVLFSLDRPVEEEKDSYLGGQFSDAEDDDSFEIPGGKNNDKSSDNDSYEYCEDDEISDEDCDVYIRDPEEIECKEGSASKNVDSSDVTELEVNFPSLAAVSTIPYESNDNEGNENRSENRREEHVKRKESEEECAREASLKPIAKDGKTYNSFRNYQHILSASGVTKQEKHTKKPEMNPVLLSASCDINPGIDAVDSETIDNKGQPSQSRVMGGIGMSGQGTEVDDDGEGWISSTKEIAVMKANGTLYPSDKANNNQQRATQDLKLPPNNCRAACATTDFAMQNVILQMNLELVSVDGMKIRKLKSWVTRCAACYKVYTGSENDGKRLFCGQCGSDRLQRVAASLDGKTGRMRLHLRKDYRHNTRGTKFNLPDPGKGNKFMGDLLLREDQLLYGAWNQRMKRSNSKKGKESIFGSDIASTVGCHADLTKRDDICVGFGRKNPNASKSGRERRGKKKKSHDKACGLRRY